MYNYYVHVPNSDFPTAEVEGASSTKHARTSYLDYLSRSGRISWRDRQNLRGRILAQRMQPGEIRAQVVLDYSARDIPTTEVEVPEELGVGEGYEEVPEPTPEETKAYSEQPAQPQSIGVPSVLGKVPSVLPSTTSPIIRMSRKSRGA